MESLWQTNLQLPRFDALKQDIKTDVLIVGGGITGLLCAYTLQTAGVPYILVEAQRITSGVTKNTTAKITSQHGLIYHKLIQTFGKERAQLYLQANQMALERYRVLCENIDCDFEIKDAFVYTTIDKRKIEQEVTAVNTLGFPAEFVTDLPLPLHHAGAVRFPLQAQFHPLKFLGAIAPKLNIYEQTKVLAFTPEAVITSGGKIKADNIIVATHFPIWNRHGSYFIKLYQQRSYVLALKGAQDVRGMYVDEADDGLSFRNYGDLLLLGGGSHRTGKKGGAWQVLQNFAEQYYPAAMEQYRWATQDCIPLDSLPYIGQYSKRTPRVFTASGYQKWGMTTAMIAAELLKDLILEQDNPYVDVFSPSRSILRPQLLRNVLESSVHLLTPTVPRCPHLGCALKYNPQEHSWDCPCHGSRFTHSGKLLDPPSTGDLNIPK